MFKMDEDFKNWLNRNRYGTYNGTEIKPETALVSYTYVISFIVMTYRNHTRYYFKEAEKGKALAAKLLCTLCNLTVGWWGIPWGPIWTIKETFCNLIDNNQVFWASFAGKPIEEKNQDSASIWEQETKPKEEVIKEAPKKRKIKTQDLIIYILIGLVIGIACIVADFMGYF